MSIITNEIRLATKTVTVTFPKNGGECEVECNIAEEFLNPIKDVK